MPLIYYRCFGYPDSNAGFPNKWLAIASLLMALGIMLAVGCRKTDETIAKDNLKIGMLIPLSGAAASAGESAQAGATLAIRDVSEYLNSTGSGLEIEFTIKDTGSDPETALQQLEELDGQGVRFIIGPYSSAAAAASLDYADQQGVILLSPSSVASSLAIADDNLFGSCPVTAIRPKPWLPCSVMTE